MKLRLALPLALGLCLAGCGSTNKDGTTRDFTNTNAMYTPDMTDSLPLRVVKTAGMGEGVKDAKAPEDSVDNGLFGANGTALLNLNDDLVVWTRGGGSLLSGISFSLFTGLFSAFPDLKYIQYVEFVDAQQLPLDASEDQLNKYVQGVVETMADSIDSDINGYWKSPTQYRFSGEKCMKYLTRIDAFDGIDIEPGDDCAIYIEPEIVRKAGPGKGNPEGIPNSDKMTTVVKSRITILIETLDFARALNDNAFLYIPAMRKKQRDLHLTPNFPHMYHNDNVLFFIEPKQN